MYERRIWRGCWIYVHRSILHFYLFIDNFTCLIHALFVITGQWCVIHKSQWKGGKMYWKEKGHSWCNCWFRFPSICLFFSFDARDSSLPNQQTSDEKKLFGNDELRWWRSLFFPFFVKRGKRGSIFLGEWKLSSCCFLLFGKPSWWNILTRVE